MVQTKAQKEESRQKSLKKRYKSGDRSVGSKGGVIVKSESSKKYYVSYPSTAEKREAKKEAKAILNIGLEPQKRRARGTHPHYERNKKYREAKKELAKQLATNLMNTDFTGAY